MKKTIRSLTAGVLALLLAGCSGSSAAKNDEKTIKVGATLVPHAEILNGIVKEKLQEKGYTLEVVEFSDYVQPNTSLEEGELDANYFQTLGYMNGQNEERGLHLVAVKGVHIEPMGIYSSKISGLDELEDGATISVPNDTDNESRGLSLLIANGLLVDPGTAEYTSDQFNGNSETNPHNFEIKPLEAGQLPIRLDDVDASVINGNYALEADLPSSHPALVIEEFDDETAVRRTNFIVVKEGSENSEKIKALVEAVASSDVENYINETYKGAVIPSFIDPAE